MKVYDICIIEDELPATLALEQDIRASCPQAGQIWTHTSLQDGVNAIEAHDPKIVLLDIQLGKRNGFELFDFFPQPSFQTIMVTAYESFALRAIKAQVADYILKPVETIQLQAAFNAAISRLDNNINNTSQLFPERIAIPAQDRITLVETMQVLYCEAEGNYCLIYLKNGEKICASFTLGSMMRRLDPERFIRVHQSYLIARDSIYRFFHAEGGKVELKNGILIPVSRSYKQAFLHYLKSFLEK
ncbi:MAG: LytR/AlgR family response regulator transcription factor [Chitinophagaceae bacterium]